MGTPCPLGKRKSMLNTKVCLKWTGLKSGIWMVELWEFGSGQELHTGKDKSWPFLTLFFEVYYCVPCHPYPTPLWIISSTKWGSGKGREMSTMQTGSWEPALINGQFYGSFVKKETWTELSVYFSLTIQPRGQKARCERVGWGICRSQLNCANRLGASEH